MTSSRWQKRFLKFRGTVNQIFSFFTLRYTGWNRKQLRCAISARKIDRLHVGCGDVFLDGWLNIFYEKRKVYGVIENNKGKLSLNYNLLKPWPVDDDSVQFIAGSHFIEHLDLNHGIKFLNESFRVMKKGGVIRLSCPDLELYARNYVNRNKDFFDQPLIRTWCTFKNAQTPGEIFIAKAYDSGGSHKWFYDFESLQHILGLAGFKEVKRRTRLEGEVPDLSLIELGARELESVYVEARKP